MRDNKSIKVKAVLPNTPADNEGVINFATTDIVVGENTYTASEYTARIAGILAGTPLNISATFTTLPEVISIPVMTKDQYDEESQWSDTLSVTMPKNKIFINSFIERFIAHFTIIYQILQQLL